MLLLFIIDRLSMGENLMSGTSVTTFTNCSTSLSYTHSKTPRKRKLHHWSTLFTISPYFWNTLTSWITYLLFFMIRFYQYLFQVLILNIYISNHSDSVLLLQNFYKSWKYFYFILAQDLPNINTKRNLWLLKKYTNEVTHNWYKLHK